MLWAVNSVFDPATHMTVDDLQAESLVNPSNLVHIKCSKTDPFRVSCDIYVGHGVGSVCSVRALGSYLSLHGSAPGPLFMFSDGHPLTLLCSQFYMVQGTLAHTLVTAFVLQLQQLRRHVGFLITLGRWSSDAYQIYIRNPVSSIVSVSAWRWGLVAWLQVGQASRLF